MFATCPFCNGVARVRRTRELNDEIFVRERYCRAGHNWFTVEVGAETLLTEKSREFVVKRVEAMVNKEKSRVPRSDRSMTDAQVAECRRLVRDGQSISSLARAIGVDKHSMSRAVKGQTYKHVAEAPVEKEAITKYHGIHLR